MILCSKSKSWHACGTRWYKQLFTCETAGRYLQYRFLLCFKECCERPLSSRRIEFFVWSTLLCKTGSTTLEDAHLTFFVEKCLSIRHEACLSEAAEAWRKKLVHVERLHNRDDTTVEEFVLCLPRSQQRGALGCSSLFSGPNHGTTLLQNPFFCRTRYSSLELLQPRITQSSIYSLTSVSYMKCACCSFNYYGGEHWRPQSYGCSSTSSITSLIAPFFR